LIEIRKKREREGERNQKRKRKKKIDGTIVDMREI
jgi:hypothetical protein